MMRTGRSSVIDATRSPLPAHSQIRYPRPRPIPLACFLTSTHKHPLQKLQNLCPSYFMTHVVSSFYDETRSSTKDNLSRSSILHRHTYISDELFEIVNEVDKIGHPSVEEASDALERKCTPFERPTQAVSVFTDRAFLPTMWRSPMTGVRYFFMYSTFVQLKLQGG